MHSNPCYTFFQSRFFKRAIYEKPSTINGQKREEEDAVIGAGSSTKGFAQSFIPLITYYKALSENDMTW